MRIIELRSENFKRIKAIAIRPDGSLIQITGRNGHGKSSLLDSIHVALAGKSVAPPQPIRKGQRKSTIRVSLGDREVELIVTRTFTKEKNGEEYTTNLTVESPDGAIFRSPQKLLDDLLGALSFDPLAFARAPAKEQADMLKRLVPGVDFDGIEAQNEADYHKRRDINRRAKELRAQAEGIAVPTDIAMETIDESALVDELEKAGERNAEIETRRARRERLAGDAGALRVASEREQEKAAELRQRAQELLERAQIAEAQAKAQITEADQIDERLRTAEELPAPIETAGIRQQIERAKEHNALVGQAQQRANLESKAELLEQEAETLTQAMEERNESKAKAIAAANLPVPGLAFGSGEVTLAGVPFEQASDAEQLRTSVAIAAALNSKLKVVRIRDGSLLDEDSMKQLAEFCDEHDMQCWIEVVDSSGKVGFVIEDGMLKQQDEAQEAAAG